MNEHEVLHEIVGRLEGEVRELLHLVQRGQLAPAAVEGRLQGVLRAGGAQMAGVLLEAADPLRPGVAVHDHRTRHIVTLLGPVDICRRRYDDNHYPLDEALGLAGQGGYTQGVQEAVSLLSCECSFAAAADLARRLLGLPLSPPSVAQMAEAAGAQAARLVPPPPVQTAAGHTLVLQTDGVQAPLRDGWHEVKIGELFLNESRVKKPGGRRQILAKEYLGALEEAGVFGWRLWQAAERWQAPLAKRVVVMGDGAPWIWNLAAEHFPQAVEIVDFYHAAEHLWEVGEALWGERTASQATRDWVRHYRQALRKGRVDLVLAAIARGRDQQTRRLAAARVEIIRRNLGYFQTNRHRMAYDQFRRWRLPIGTGPAEGSCKFLVQQRFKKPGARWSQPGLPRLLALKVLRENGHWERLWPHLRAA